MAKKKNPFTSVQKSYGEDRKMTWDWDSSVEYAIGGRTIDTQGVMRRYLNRTMLAQMKWGEDLIEKIKKSKIAAQLALDKGETSMPQVGRSGDIAPKNMIAKADAILDAPETQRTYGAWEGIKRALVKTDMEMGHKNFGVSTAVLVAYLEANSRSPIADQAEQRAFRQELKALLLAQQQVDNYSYEKWLADGSPAGTKEGIATVLDEMEKIANKGYDITNHRNLVVDMAQGKVNADATIDMEKQKFNQFKGKLSQAFGQIADEAWFGQTTGTLQKRLGKSGEDFAYIEGSKSLIRAMTEQIMDIGASGKSKKYVSKKTVVTNVKPNHKQDISKHKAKVKKVNAQLKKEIQNFSKVQGAKSVTRSSGAGSRQSDLQLLTLLKAKLPQTVAQNMGPPGLVNRTGRFASSVTPTDVSRTAQGYPSVGYTYRKNPYQVFEMGVGDARWATPDRDPRKVIDMSIREIAAQLVVGRLYTRRQ